MNFDSTSSQPHFNLSLNLTSTSISTSTSTLTSTQYGCDIKATQSCEEFLFRQGRFLPTFDSKVSNAIDGVAILSMIVFFSL